MLVPPLGQGFGFGVYEYGLQISYILRIEYEGCRVRVFNLWFGIEDLRHRHRDSCVEVLRVSRWREHHKNYGSVFGVSADNMDTAIIACLLQGFRKTNCTGLSKVRKKQPGTLKHSLRGHRSTCCSAPGIDGIEFLAE